MVLDTHGLSTKRTVLGLATLLGGAALAAGAIVGTAAGVGAVWHATNPSSAAPGASAPAAAAAPKSTGIALTVKDVKTPEGSQPAYVGPNGTGAKVLFSVKAGEATTVTITNRSDQPHTFSSSALGVNVMVPPGPSTVHFTVDAKKPGLESWDCTVPCGAWTMSHAGYMQGSVKVLS